MSIGAICSILNNRLTKSTIQNCTFMNYLSHSFNNNNKHTTLILPLIKKFLVKIYFFFDMLKSIIGNMSSVFYYYSKYFIKRSVKKI
jgi:hypothetical protein